MPVEVITPHSRTPVQPPSQRPHIPQNGYHTHHDEKTLTDESCPSAFVLEGFMTAGKLLTFSSLAQTNQRGACCCLPESAVVCLPWHPSDCHFFYDYCKSLSILKTICLLCVHVMPINHTHFVLPVCTSMVLWLACLPLNPGGPSSSHCPGTQLLIFHFGLVDKLTPGETWGE